MKSFLITLILYSMAIPLCLGAQVAIVSASKAVIYADINLNAAIGYVKKGKNLAVGDIKRKRGKVLPVLVNKQVAWIRVSDVFLPDEDRPFDDNRKVSEHDIEVDKEVKDPFDQNNYLTIKLAPSSFSLKGTADSGDINEALESGNELSVMYEHKNPYRKLHWGVGLDFFTGKLNVFSFQSLSLKAGLAYVPIRLSWVSVELFGNLLLTGDFRVTSEGLGTYKGNMLGMDYGIAARLFPEYKIGLTAGIGYSYYSFSGLKGIARAGEENEDIATFSNIGGAKVFAGLSYKF